MKNQINKKQQIQIKCPKGRAATLVCVSNQCDHNAFCCQQLNCCQKLFSHKCKFKKVQQFTKNYQISCQRSNALYNSSLQFIQNIKKMVDNQLKNFKEWNQRFFQIKRRFTRSDTETISTQQVSKIFQDINQYNEQYFQDVLAYFKEWDKNLRQQFASMRLIICDKNLKKSNNEAKIITKNVNQNLSKNFSLTTRIVWGHNQKNALLQILNSLKNVTAVNLLFHAGSYQFSVSKFHQICDGIPNTLVIIKNDKEKIYGGFTPVPWGKSKFQKFIADNSLRTFVFSLSHQKKYHLREEQKRYAIQWNSLFGPLFGRCNIVQVWDKANKQPNYWQHTPFSFKPSYGQWTDQIYQQILGVEKYQQFKLLDWQVFQVNFQ